MGAVLYAGLIRLSGGLPPDLREGSNDLEIYRQAGESVLQGAFPYRDFFLEYPPGSLPAFLPPALLSDTRSGFIDLFSSEMAIALVVALILVALTARRPGGLPAWPVPALTFVAGALLLYPVAVTRYDAVVALALATAAFAAGRYPVPAYAAVGLGAAAKLVPALAVLPLVLWRRSLVPGLAAFFVVVAVFFVPALALGGRGFVESFAYHADRGLQVESVAASIFMALGRIESVVFEFGAFEARGPGAGFAAGLSVPLMAILIVITGLQMYREHRLGRLDGADFPRWAAALILAFMLGSKVLSPQYMVWLLPLAPLCAPGLAGAGLCALFLAACLATTLVFPIHYADLLTLRPPGPELLLGRNALLVALWALLLVPRGKGSREGSV